jgi:hypothetical protein
MKDADAAAAGPSSAVVAGAQTGATAAVDPSLCTGLFTASICRALCG